LTAADCTAGSTSKQITHNRKHHML